ncbi:MAG: hypothetical protein AAGF94_00640 [Pseudomonadota bacterium]
MTGFIITALIYSAFALGFFAGLRTVPGTIGRLEFVLGVLAVTLIGWFVVADTMETAAALSVTSSIVGAVGLITGFITGALSISFARWLNRSERFAWLLLVPFSLPIMALMEPRKV